MITSLAPTGAGGGGGGGGGGGTFVWKQGEATLLAVAGGGGGASRNSPGKDGNDEIYGLNSLSNYSSGGDDGNGGTVERTTDGGSGGGWFTAGSCPDTMTGWCGGGKSSSFVGGLAHFAGHAKGGFGGGGAGGERTGGGGGGYSGGATGEEAGGGGSFAIDKNAMIMKGGNKELLDGFVILVRPCPHGQARNNAGICAEYDACDLNPCGANATCRKTTTGFTCECTLGFELFGRSCQDIDACAIAPCPGGVRCLDKPPPYKGNANGRSCVCPVGEYFNDDGVCVNINACLTAPCSPHASGCVDFDPPADGSKAGRMCQPCVPPLIGDGEVCQCDQVGMIEKDGSCEDLDACINNPCKMAHSFCRDLVGKPDNAEGRECICATPFVNNTEGACVCAEGDDDCRNADACSLFPCDEYATCELVSGADPTSSSGRKCTCYPTFEFGVNDGVCECPQGTVLFENFCDDINACASTPCPKNSVCVDKPPPALNNKDGRVCSCDPGYEFKTTMVDSVMVEICEQINACKKFPCPENSVCRDLMPPAGGDEQGRVCECNVGYHLVDGKECKTIDECNPNPCGMNSQCSPTPSANWPFQCTCETGYEKPQGTDVETVNCINIDACVGFPCSGDLGCTDLPPPAGNDENGRTCGAKVTSSENASSLGSLKAAVGVMATIIVLMAIFAVLKFTSLGNAVKRSKNNYTVANTVEENDDQEMIELEKELEREIQEE
eukprot:m.129675 g.129675  ORF g.129675 m.129675 type:complete len:724 (+) comp14583_c0_seq2:1690-3861(+)